MTRFILRRLLSLLPTLLIIVVISFLIIRLAPGSPFSSERAVPPEVLRDLEMKYGFNETLTAQLWHYLRNLLHGDLGLSTKYPQRSVNELIAAGLPHTLLLGGVALIWALMLGLTAGIVGAVKQNSRWDYFLMALALIGLSVPTFVMGPLLINFFALKLMWLPPAGFSGWRHVLLPALTLGTVYAAYIARLTRSGMLEVLSADFIRTAYAKGLGTFTVVWRHALRGGLLPVVSFLGPAIASLMVGSVVVEKIFNIPGIGPYFVDAAFNRDYFLVMGIILVESVFLLTMNMVVDVAYSFLDPRIRYE